MMKKLFPLFIFLLMFSTVRADEPQKFSPEKFQADLEQFISQEASLTAEEKAKFFPLYREMLQKQRAVYQQMKDLGRNKPADETGCKQAVQKRDALELELRRILQTYHNKFFSLMPASKVYDVIIAENRFHRRALRNFGNHHRQQNQQHKK